MLGMLVAVREPARIGYGLAEQGGDFQAQTWELKSRSPVSVLAFLLRRLTSSAGEGLRMELAKEHLALSGHDYPYYTPLAALRPGRYTAPFHRRMATLAWLCLAERCVELPVARAFLDERPWSRLLEVGNVLGYWYELPKHIVVDRYERGRGITNVDIVDFRSPEAFDAIVSVSTLEHIGFDEPRQDPTKFLRAVQALERLRAPNGRILFSVPIGYNPSVDRAIEEHALDAYRLRAVVSGPGRRSGWHEVSVADALSQRSGLIFATLA